MLQVFIRSYHPTLKKAQGMSSRIIPWVLCAVAFVGLLVARADAKSSRGVTIVRGVGFDDSTEYQSALPTNADPPSDSDDDASLGWGSDTEQCAGGQSCNSADGSCCAPFGLSAGAEATFLKPSFQNSNDFGFDSNFRLEAAPRVWLQWQNQNGWGLRARYWNLDAQQQLNAAEDFGDSVVAASIQQTLDVYAVDLELTRNFTVRNTNFCASFGARNGRLQDRTNAHLSVFDLAGGGGDDASAILEQANRTLSGTGFTMGLGIRRPIMQSRLAAVCNLRGSVLWGGNKLDVSGTVIEVLPVGVGDLDLNDFQQFNFLGSNGKGMWIGEIQAGGEWNTPIDRAFRGGNAIMRVMFEGQWWNLPGVSTGGGGPVTADQLYQFVGFTAMAGFIR